ncbi:MAG TPA: signal peptidase II [Tabrizicola sp.]|nr:signal peptidase II [Tabrizicola sp.]
MRLFWITAAVAFGLDQLSKYGVLYGLDLLRLGELDVLPPYLVFRMQWNYGINFGLLSGQSDLTRWLLIVLALAISAWVIWWMRREKGNYKALIAGGLLLGGALGNVIDRFVFGAVADFLNMSCCGIENPFAFNVADVAIFAGAFGLVLFAGGTKPGKPARPKR